MPARHTATWASADLSEGPPSAACGDQLRGFSTASGFLRANSHAAKHSG